MSVRYFPGISAVGQPGYRFPSPKKQLVFKGDELPATSVDQNGEADTATFSQLGPSQEKTKRQRLLESIAHWGQQLPKELQQNLPLDDLDERQLEQQAKALAGLYELRHSKTWRQVRDALELYLDLTGPNVANTSCGPVSLTHAKRLGTGLPMSAIRYKDCKIGYSKQKIILETPEYIRASSENQLAMTDALHERLLKTFDIKQEGIKFTPDIRVIEQKLLKEGNGAQALIFNTKILESGTNMGHVTLAVNIRGQIFHIDNNSTRSAVVTPLRTQLFWYQHQFLERFPHWNPALPLPNNVGKFSYGILNTRIMDYIASGQPLEVPPIPSVLLPPIKRKGPISQRMTSLLKSIWGSCSWAKVWPFSGTMRASS